MRAVCGLLVAALLLASCGDSSDPEPVATTAGVAGPSEIMAEPVSSAGENPFTEPAGKDVPDLDPPAGAVRPSGGPPRYRGSLPGLYGGTRNYATCDAQQLITFLEANPDKAAAWAGTLGIRPDQIRSYVQRLTPVLLRTDTRVTNHGFANGRATSLQSVLQAGTAVFVNRYGEPVVKCYCGNPLTPPILYERPVYVGPRWPRFEVRYVTIIERTVRIIDTYVLYDTKTGKTFTRPAGTDGDLDIPEGRELPEPMTPVPPTEPPPPQPPPGTPPAQPAPPETTPAQPEQPEQPVANFSPNPGQAGDTFTLAASGFRPGARLDVTLTRPDGHVEQYAINVESDGGGSYVFPADPTVITGTYTAVVRNPATGAEAHTSVQVLPRGGG
jgi:pyruvate/2-oxoglutarate dehydrogenase complex dihydrolipoamide acyltransferase (E2) component